MQSSASFIQYLLTSSSSFSCHFYPSFYLSFHNVFYKAVPMQNMTHRASLHSLYCIWDISFHLDCM